MVLEAALRHECTCGGRAKPGWEQILSLNSIDIFDYRKSLLAAFRGGGGKGLNHMYIGAPSTGKTALTRPILALFGTFAFVKPQKDTTFALEGLIGSQVVVWNDFRWPLPPLSWGDMLNMLDNEAFRVAVPKVDGAKDYHWNASDTEKVVCFLTSNAPVVHVSGGAVNTVETAAWNERFGSNLYTFNTPLPHKDARYKQWFSCTRCYAEWVCSAGGAASEPSMPQEVAPPGPRGLQLPQAKRFRAGPPGGDAVAAGASAPPASASARPVVAAAPVLPEAAVALRPAEVGSAEPVRELHARAQRLGGQLSCTENLVTPRGPWRCSLSALGKSAAAEGQTKKEAKKAAAFALLALLQ